MNSTRISRIELHKLVWSTPLRRLATTFGVSDVAVAKACRRGAVPIPGRGYWAKLAARKPTQVDPLPPRPLGGEEFVVIGGHNWYDDRMLPKDDLLEPIPPPPMFDEPIDALFERA